MIEPIVPTSTGNGLRMAAPWVRRALLASLGVNLLVLGLAAGAGWHFTKAPPPRGNSLYTNLVGFARTLPADRRRELGVSGRNEMVPQGDANRPFSALRPLSEEVFQVR
jgi:hypothetical protein